MKKQKIEIWDSLPDHCIPKEERDKTAQKLLVALDKLYEEDIRKSGKAFSKFQRRMASDILLQPDGYDCGIFVIKYMQQSKNYVKKDRSFKFDSEEERLNLALQLLRSDINENRKTLYDKVWESYNVQRVNEHDPDLSKGKCIDKCKTFSEDVGRRAYKELDSSHERVGKNVGLEKGKAIMRGAGENISASNTEKNPTNLEGAGKAKMRRAGGRPKSEVWKHVSEEDDNQVKCNHCGFIFAKSANRIKSHIDPTHQRKGIRLCNRFQAGNPNKRFKPSTSAPNPEMNSTPTNLKGHGKGYLLPATDLVEEQFQGYIEDIWDWLMEDEVSAIGVWGMAGAGKTALVTHIHNKLLEEADARYHVIWVTVSRNESISQLQRDIAKSIGLDITDEYNVKRLAGKLLHEFKEMNKCVLILDEVWDHISLEDVGFPISDKGIKLILTTCSREVCRSMNCKENIIKVELLDEEDGWNLFEKTLGVHQILSPEVEQVAQQVMHECKGLPLAIVTIARSMKGKNDVSEWNHTLESLRNLENGQDDMDKWVFPRLRSSYAHLNNKLLECFLYCALYTKNDDCRPLRLCVREFVHEGWIDGMKRLEEQYNECMSILNKLSSNCCLEDYDYFGRIYVHDLFRVMVRREKNDTIMAKAHMSLTEVPEDYKWGENLQKVFLNCNHIQKIPDGMSPRCSQLSTLHLNDNDELESIPDDFFINMPSLRVLDLSSTGIRRLPTSVSNLECLVALLLSGCVSLSDMPSLAKQQRLRSLDLYNTAITKAPFGLELLINLWYLSLQGTEKLVMSASSIIPKLTNLQCLYLDYITEIDVRAEDLVGLKALKNVVASFCNVEVFNAYVTSLLNIDHAPENYIFLASDTYGLYPNELQHFVEFGSDEDSKKMILFESMELGNTRVVLPKDMKELKIRKCHIRSRCICHVSSFYPSQMGNFKIWRCDVALYLCCMASNCPFCSSVQHVEHLELWELKDLKSIVAPLTPAMRLTASFPHLKSLHIIECNSVKTLLTPELFQNLKSIYISKCASMEEIVSNRSGQEDIFEMLLDYTIELPNLTHMTLENLPELKSVHKGIMLCRSLQYFRSTYCTNLTLPLIKKIPEGDILLMKEIPHGYEYRNY